MYTATAYYQRLIVSIHLSHSFDRWHTFIISLLSILTWCADNVEEICHVYRPTDLSRSKDTKEQRTLWYDYGGLTVELLRAAISQQWDARGYHQEQTEVGSEN